MWRNLSGVLTALGYFREVVCKGCERVRDNHIDALAGVLGVDAGDLRRSPHAAPDRTSLGVESVELGCKAKRQEGLYLYFYVNWDRDGGDPPLSVRMHLYIGDRGRRESLATALDNLYDDLRKDPAFAGEPWDYKSYRSQSAFWIILGESEFSLFEEKLDQLLGFVIPFLKSVEGIQKFFAMGPQP